MRFTCFSEWEQLPASASKLFEKAEQQSFFFSRPWFENLVIASLHEDQSMALACVVDDENVLAILPLMQRPGNNWSSLSNYYTSLYTLLMADESQQEILNCLARGLYQLPLQSLRLQPVAEDDENILRLEQAMVSHGFESHRGFRLYNWHHRLEGQSFQQYMAARPARIRNTIERKQRKLQREHGYEIRLFTGGDLEQAVADYNKLYKASWKANEAFAGFIESLVNNLSKPGWLRFAILYAAGEPVAGQIWLVVKGKANIFRLAYDEDWKRYSPGSILTRYLMEQVIDND